jgi:poly(3-hydroxybutyrate) depolymerase
MVSLLAVVLVLAGCSDDDSGGKGGRPSGRDERPQTVADIPMKTGTHKQKLDVGTFGHREFLVHVPPKLTRGKWRNGRPEEPLPLVVALHGGLANMGWMQQLTGFDELSDEKGFLVAYPDGFLTTWNAGNCCGAAKTGKIDDVGFLTKLITNLTDSGLADPGRVYVTGFSNGAGMAYRMACERPDKVAGIGVVEGALVTHCDPGRPVATMIFHGTADRNVPFHGGGRRDINDDRPYPPVSYAVDFWRRVGGLPEMRHTVRGSGRFDCESTGKGADDAEVTLCKVRGGTHSWPSGVSATLWDFFAAHSRG